MRGRVYLGDRDPLAVTHARDTGRADTPMHLRYLRSGNAAVTERSGWKNWFSV